MTFLKEARRLSIVVGADGLEFIYSLVLTVSEIFWSDWSEKKQNTLTVSVGDRNTAFHIEGKITKKRFFSILPNNFEEIENIFKYSNVKTDLIITNQFFGIAFITETKNKILNKKIIQELGKPYSLITIKYLSTSLVVAFYNQGTAFEKSIFKIRCDDFFKTTNYKIKNL